jgi:hypothetical protein
MPTHKAIKPAAKWLEYQGNLSLVTPGLTVTPGWFVRRVNGITIVAKDRAASGYSSQFRFVPDRGDAVIFILNLQGQPPSINAVHNQLLTDTSTFCAGLLRRITAC